MIQTKVTKVILNENSIDSVSANRSIGRSLLCFELLFRLWNCTSWKDILKQFENKPLLQTFQMFYTACFNTNFAFCIQYICISVICLLFVAGKVYVAYVIVLSQSVGNAAFT
jgi:hypothetical protein